VFFALVLAAAVLTLVLHRPDYDDAFFLSIPVQALETPDAPLFEVKITHGFTPHPMVPTYTVHSVELAAGMLARLLGVPPITAAHMILPVIFAVVFICGAARLLRFLLGRAWLLGLTALFFLLLFNGDSHWSYGNFGLVRFFHGKAFLAAGMVPLLSAYGLEFMSGGRRGLWPLLFLGQAAAVGLNSAGLYVGPAVIGLTLLGAWRPGKRNAVRVLLGGLTAAYPVLMGLMLRFGPMRGSALFLEKNDSVPPLSDALGMVFGSGAVLWFWLFALAGGWAAFRDASKRRWAIGFALVFCLLFLNPLLNVFWARNLLGVMVKWRILWAIPLPVWGAVLLTALAGTAASVLKRPGLKGAALAAALALFGALVASRWTVSPANGTMVRWPSWKVPLQDYRLAQEAAGMTDSGRGFLAPETISVWVSTFTMKLKLIVSREFSIVYLYRMTAGEERRREVERRLSLLRYISGTAREAPGEEMIPMLKEAVADYDIQTVVLPLGNPWRREIESALREMGFAKRLLSSRKYTAYVNPRAGPAKRP
jgi:MFS family permease